jgi:hypothetical protein
MTIEDRSGMDITEPRTKFPSIAFHHDHCRQNCVKYPDDDTQHTAPQPHVENEGKGTYSQVTPQVVIASDLKSRPPRDMVSSPSPHAIHAPVTCRIGSWYV